MRQNTKLNRSRCSNSLNAKAASTNVRRDMPIAWGGGPRNSVEKANFLISLGREISRKRPRRSVLASGSPQQNAILHADHWSSGEFQ
jgi:hypothetical protein